MTGFTANLSNLPPGVSSMDIEEQASESDCMMSDFYACGTCGGTHRADVEPCRAIRLTAAQQSALECACIDEDTPMLAVCWIGGSRLVFSPDRADALAAELTEAANSEDGNGNPDRGARGARDALTNLAAKVRADARPR